MSDPPVENDGGVDAAHYRGDASFDLGDHAAADCAVGDEIGDVVGGQVGQQSAAFVQNARHIGQQEQAGSPNRRRNRTRHGVGVDIIGCAVGTCGNRRNDGDHILRGQPVKNAPVDNFWFPNEAQVDDLFNHAAGVPAAPGDFPGGDQMRVLAADPDCGATGTVDPGNQFLVDRPQYHFGNFGRCCIGDPQPVDKFRFDAESIEHRTNLRTTAVDDHRIDANGFQQYDIFGKILRQRRVAHRMATIFHHEGLTGILLEIGQRLDKCFDLGEHFWGGGVVGHRGAIAGQWPRGKTMSAGYSGTPLFKKLGVADGQLTWRLAMPDSVASEIAEGGVRPVLLDAPVAGLGMAHLFVTSRADLDAQLTVLRFLLASTGMIWVSWPKKAAKVPTDITEDTIRAVALPMGYVDVKVCAVDAVWSGLKLVIRKSER